MIGSGEKIPVAVLGATGAVGQRFVALLANHPWFALTAVTGSERSAGKKYADAVRWTQVSSMPPAAADLTVGNSEPPVAATIAFSALDASVAGETESAFAAAGTLVVSNAKSHRMSPDVPLVVPEVNPEHLERIRHSPHAPGAIITNPNCSTIGLVMALKPLDDAFGLERVSVVTLQAVSGAGLTGASSYEMLDNVVPFIPEEEEKIERETAKILANEALTLSAQCNRVPVLDGHLCCVSVGLRDSPGESDVKNAWERFSGEPQERSLPTAPAQALEYREEADAPQPRRHRDSGGGMTVTIGRLRPCPVLDYKFVTLSHNTIRGAAGGAILIAELAVAKGLAGSESPCV